LIDANPREEGKRGEMEVGKRTKRKKKIKKINLSS